MVLALLHPGVLNPRAQAQLYHGIVDKLKSTPGITHAALSSALPFLAQDSQYPFKIPGRDLSRDPFVEGDRIRGMARRVTPDYFTTLGVRILRGRAFSDSDADGTEPVVVIDEGLADRYFKGEDPLDRHIQFAQQPARIIGVAASIRQLEPGSVVERPLFYLPLYVHPINYAGILLRGSGDLGQAMREAVRSVDSTQAIFAAQPLEERVRVLLAPKRVTAWLLAFFAGAALFLSALGLYGVISYSVSQRVPEIGVRMALGAQASQVTRLVLSQGLQLAAAGAAIGLLGATAAARVLTRQLFQVGVFDPVAFGGTAALLICVAAAASWLPARRAAAVDPLIALRRD